MLDRHEVEYIVVGGVAARAHGARRATQDLDCLVRRSRANLSRLADALRELNARLRVSGMSDEEMKALPVQIEAETLARTEISTWRTDAGDVDVLADLRDKGGARRSYEDLLPRASRQSTEGVSLVVVGLDDLIESKSWANRDKDRAALPELRQLSRSQVAEDDVP